MANDDNYRRPLAIIVTAQLLGTSLWFSAADDLARGEPVAIGRGRSKDG
jgi:hypothetical protein